ncbi:permease [Paracidobacterium acidisoli]|uniref:Permease n=1 Tax=Paracidobacterium acidisoli TaxID=2303751 RepID=A0A372IU53_9BACT|nr:permease [Paracidobacterium acidisoli]MBT9329917.1 permease [Paracidobacterium acidisoli]
MPFAVFNIRRKSLVRATGVVIASITMAFLFSGFPNIHPSLLLLIPTVLVFYGTWETARCLRLRWSFYHGGVMLLLYMDVMAIVMILFLLLYPYAGWLERT